MHLEVKRSCQEVGCARNRLLFHTVLLKPSLSLLMQVYAWMEYQLFDLWDLVIEVFHSSPEPNQQNQRCKRAPGKLVGNSITKP